MSLERRQRLVDPVRGEEVRLDLVRVGQLVETERGAALLRIRIHR
jgi:hypothetical protein